MICLCTAHPGQKKIDSKKNRSKMSKKNTNDLFMYDASWYINKLDTQKNRQKNW